MSDTRDEVSERGGGEHGHGESTYAGGCPSRDVLDRIGDKWTVLVLGELANSGAKRYAALRGRLDGVSEKMLTQTLRALERDGLVRRTIHPEIPPRVEYELTELGVTLRGPLLALTDWSMRHMDEVLEARAAYDQGKEASHESAGRAGG
ncbi:winged helix-turn-helix transcriptional regulator [Streptomyces violaceusniger]|uniref:Transcriptional regulator, HxlR family n=1 Tax=Streptomyces violaceusniger (strain Tu 4113) TaxID=653045 RepID=G2P2X4_STRV4|nr:helix-turn-helix domain-containing protein [Streptomyces violaceusniger]AEM82475.1 transcriptional regulator, HxlR family [Streptomyces violaceusniger Tu 4113]